MAAPMPRTRRAARADAYENPREELQRHVPATARRVLDLGCASGALGAALKGRGAAVVGIERDPVYAAAARERLDEVVEADLETFEPARLGRFDVLVAGDVLEHLADPWSVLPRIAAVGEPGGTVIV
jgi:2-polyprenyl-3-methyl-5-hydroxy-6-metoxy-1,4-benzoquinol methylase